MPWPGRDSAPNVKQCASRDDNRSSGLRNFAAAKAGGPGAAQSPVCQLAKIARAEVLTNPYPHCSPTPPALVGLSVTFDSEAFFCSLPIAIPLRLFAFTCFPFDTAAISLQYVNTQKDFQVCSSPGAASLSQLAGRIDTKKQPFRRRLVFFLSCLFSLALTPVLLLSQHPGAQQKNALLLSETRHLLSSYMGVL